jgi:hypothetical protein
VLALQRTAGNQAVQQMFGTTSGRLLRTTSDAVTPTSTPGVDPWPATKAIDAWRAKADKLLDGTAAFQTANMIHYLGRTSSNPSLSWADSQLAGVMSNAVGNFFTEAGGEAIEVGSKMTAAAIGAAIGTGGEPGLGTVIGFVVGVLIESAASIFFEQVTGANDPGETAADAAARVTRFIQEQHKLVYEQQKLATSELDAIVTSAHYWTEHAASQADADAIEKWATNAAVRTVTPGSIGPPYPLAFELLKVWALEHAGDLSTSHGATNAAQLEGAVAEVFGADGLQGQASMFVYQTRAEWQRAGLEHAAVSEALLTEVEALIGETGTIVDPGTIGAADPVQAAYQGKEFEFTSCRDPEALRAYINGHDPIYRVEPDFLRAKILAGDVRAYCALDVHSANESAYVDEWNWRFEVDIGPDEHPTGGRPKGQSWTLDVTFDVWPTWG